MTSGIRLLQIIDRDSPQQNAVMRRELATGLMQARAAIAPKFFYDKLGSRLFEAITELPEYYPTRTEAAIFAEHLPAIRRALGTDFTLIDLGCGSCAKAGRLFHAGVRVKTLWFTALQYHLYHGIPTAWDRERLDQAAKTGSHS